MCFYIHYTVIAASRLFTSSAMPSKERKKRERDRVYCRIHKVDESSDRKEYYLDYYHKNIKLSQERSSVSSKKSYDKAPEESREASAKRSKRAYDKAPEESREASAKRFKRAYDKAPEESREASAKRSKKAYDKAPEELGHSCNLH